MEKKNIILPSIDEIIEINKRLGHVLVNKGALEFILTKVESRRLSKNMKKDMAMAAATFWYEIIVQHPFLDGNKRTATEVMQFFLELNGFELKSPINGLIYISLKIANNDIKFDELDRWIYDKLLNQNDSTR